MSPRAPSRTAVLVQDAMSALRRFPLVLAAAALCAGVVIVLEFEAETARVLFPTALALPLFLVLRISGERGHLVRPLEVVLTLGVIGGIALLAFHWPEWAGTQRAIRYLQLSAAAHLLLAVGPFVHRGEENAFWHYNRILLTRTLGAAAYAGALFLGLGAALFAIDALFPVDVPPETYLRLLAVLGFIFTTWYIVGGLPKDLRALEELDEDPRALRVFAQFVLVPLCAVYLLILTGYFVLVLATQVWPSGWIGWLVSFMAVAGILSVLLTRPFADSPTGRWVRAWERTFWLLMLPATGMLLLAVGRRIAQYGVTEPRYFVAALCLWLAAMAIAYGGTQVRTLRLIPASLALLCILTSAGPWGAASISENSQRSRLLGLLEQNAMLEDGRAIPASTSVSQEEADEIAASLAWLLERGADPGVELPEHDAGTVSPAAPGHRRSWEAQVVADGVAEALDIHRARTFPLRTLSFSAEAGTGIPSEGFREVYLFRADSEILLNGRTVTMQVAQGGGDFELVSADGTVLHRIDLRPLVAELLTHIDDSEGAFEWRDQSVFPPEMLMAESTDGPRQVRLVIQQGVLVLPRREGASPDLRFTAGLVLVGEAR